MKNVLTWRVLGRGSDLFAPTPAPTPVPTTSTLGALSPGGDVPPGNGLKIRLGLGVTLIADSGDDSLWPSSSAPSLPS